MNRREFLKFAGATSLAAAFPVRSAFAGAQPHVVVVGGGVGGATFAKYLKMADKNIKVTLIEKNPVYIRPYGSSEVLTGHIQMKDLDVTYDALKSRYGVEMLIDTVVGFDPDKKTVSTAGGKSLAYDRLIVSPGIELKYEAIEGYSEAIANTKVPSGWIPGAQTQLLADQIKSIPKGGTFLLVAPPNPYRCPPGPYERSALVAEWFKKHNPTAKVLILDPKDAFVTDTTMQQGWNRLYGYKMPKSFEEKFVEELRKFKVFSAQEGVDALYAKGILKRNSGPSMISWVTGKEGGRVLKLDAANMTVEAENGVHKADVINIVPPMVAGTIAQKMGLTDKSGWCPIKRESFESTVHKDVHVLGDSSIADAMPKSGFSANTQAKVAALAVAASLKGQQPGIPSWENTCYALAGSDYGFFVADVFALKEGKITNVSGHRYLPLNASEAQIRLGAVYQQAWMKSFTDDCFA
ncbi:MAG: FCSD flavin-binding domain-containing protein [Halothiobacillaceae bacterium]|jgi:sulfide dehydrogenase [flavocytochrome c] flavoprotein subunit|nr:FCSD flavin-binding domain-containing protein [Halothiobacillaceae bacterium]MDY0049552.1 FCSD flavin-binding domain-containing protein [Halothiobacillaceae bacterium]